MKLVDPTLELVACGSSNHTMPTFGYWESEVLEHAWEVVDHISMHAYYEEVDGDRRSFLASGADMDSFIDGVAATIDAVAARKHSSKTDRHRVRRVERLVPDPVQRRGAAADHRGRSAARGRLQRARRRGGRRPADLPAQPRRPGADRVPGPAGQRDRPDPDRAGRRGLAPADVPPVRRRHRRRAGRRAGHRGGLRHRRHRAATARCRPSPPPPPSTRRRARGASSSPTVRRRRPRSTSSSAGSPRPACRPRAPSAADAPSGPDPLVHRDGGLPGPRRHPLARPAGGVLDGPRGEPGRRRATHRPGVIVPDALPPAGVHLRRGDTSLAVRLDSTELPCILHWGPDLGDLAVEHLPDLLRSLEMPTVDGAIYQHSWASVLPQQTSGWVGRPGLLGSRAGQAWALTFDSVDHTVTESTDRTRLTSVALDGPAGVEVTTEIELFGNGLLRLRACVRNLTETPYEVTLLEPSLPVPARGRRAPGHGRAARPRAHPAAPRVHPGTARPRGLGRPSRPRLGHRAVCRPVRVRLPHRSGLGCPPRLERQPGALRRELVHRLEAAARRRAAHARRGGAGPRRDLCLALALRLLGRGARCLLRPLPRAPEGARGPPAARATRAPQHLGGGLLRPGPAEARRARRACCRAGRRAVRPRRRLVQGAARRHELPG